MIILLLKNSTTYWWKPLFHDLPWPQSYSTTFQAWKIHFLTSVTFQDAWESCFYEQLNLMDFFGKLQHWNQHITAHKLNVFTRVQLLLSRVVFLITPEALIISTLKSPNTPPQLSLSRWWHEQKTLVESGSNSAETTPVKFKRSIATYEQSAGWAHIVSVDGTSMSVK